jgi:uncharacterized protein (TIGR02266 family)
MGTDLEVKNTAMLLADLSFGGAFIKTRMLEPVGSEIMLRFRLEPMSPPISAKGEVMWLRHAKDQMDPHTGMGIRFIDVAEDDLETLKQYIEGLLPGALSAS